MKTIEFTPEGAAPCRVVGWLHADLGNEIRDRQYPAVVICPGGAYRFCSSREAEPVAERYYAAGYNTFILYYSVGEHAGNFEPLAQLVAALSQIRRNSSSWSIAPDRIAVCGFSAGGHLAASSGTIAQTAEFRAGAGINETVLPNAMILGYPVITADEFAHVESIQYVSGSACGTERYRWFGLDKHVTGMTPPAFIWHTAEDSVVPVENSLLFAAALSRNSVPFELHIFPHGAHGMSVCSEQVETPDGYNARWVEMSIKWLDALFAHSY